MNFNKHIITFIAFILYAFLFFGLSFVIIGITPSQTNKKPAFISARGICISSDDEIYIGNSYTNQVMKFDQQGNFINAFKFNRLPGSPFAIILKDDMIGIAHYSTNTVDFFREGKLIDESKVTADSLKNIEENRYKDQYQNTYRLVNFFGYSYILKITPEGEQIKLNIMNSWNVLIKYVRIFLCVICGIIVAVSIIKGIITMVSSSNGTYNLNKFFATKKQEGIISKVL